MFVNKGGNMSEDKNQKKNPGESFAEMFKEFGAAMGEIFNDPKLKEKAKEFGESASASAKAFAGRFKDEEVKNKFKDFGQAAKKFGESMSEYFKEDKSKSGEKKENQNNSNDTTEASSDSEDESKKKLNNEAGTSAVEDKEREYWDRDRWGRDHWRRDHWKRGKHSRESRIAGYSFSIAWSIVLIIFFNFFNKYIAYYVYDSSLDKWNIQPLITNNFKAWLPILTISLIITIIGNIALIINDSFYVRNIALIVMNIFGIASVATLLTLFPFDFSVIPSADWNAILFPIIKIVLILIIIGMAIGSLVRFIKIIVHIARNDSGTLQE
jgi:hypothetical protein